MLKNKYFWCLASICFSILLCRIFVVTNLGIDLYVDEAQYWLWSQNLDFGYFSKPPAIAVQIWLSTYIFGDSLLGVKFLSMLCYVVASLVIFAIMRQLNLTEKMAFFAGITTLLLPVFSWLGLFASTDSLLVLLWILALYFFVLIVEKQQQQFLNALILGIILGCALLTKYTALVWYLCAFLYLLCYRKEYLIITNRKVIYLLVVLIVSLLIFSPNLIWNYQQNFPTLRHTAEITIQKKSAGGFLKLFEFLLSQLLISGCIVFVLYLKIFPRVFNKNFWQTTQNNQQIAINLGVFFSLPLWIIVAIQAFNKNANANWAAPAFIPAILAVCAYYDSYKNITQKYKLFIIINAISLIITLIAYSWQILQNNFFTIFIQDTKKIAKLDFYRRAKGWNQMANSLIPLLENTQKTTNKNIILLAENRTLISHLAYELRNSINVNFQNYSVQNVKNLKKISIISWNPKQNQSDYFQMITNLELYKNNPNYVFFFITDDLKTIQNANKKFNTYFQIINNKYDSFDLQNRPIYSVKMQNFIGYQFNNSK